MKHNDANEDKSKSDGKSYLTTTAMSGDYYGTSMESSTTAHAGTNNLKWTSNASMTEREPKINNIAAVEPRSSAQRVHKNSAVMNISSDKTSGVDITAGVQTNSCNKSAAV